ncbi:hypothetical protein GH714_019420 [Hevea brasiliensis]|uniref:SAC domain-containing protein n=1 Tax=Hevea brasiliensis TaxID=3981 RepID=A0A6A6LA92_HEVBR|nr:hypothetical protein GH714_019420 [Hevea brasiliensis]
MFHLFTAYVIRLYLKLSRLQFTSQFELGAKEVNKYVIKLSASCGDFKLTPIARRSRHYAGTRYLKRGVNGNGGVANEVETEQIVFEDVPEGYPVQISSVVQGRGSIPLFWKNDDQCSLKNPSNENDLGRNLDSGIGNVDSEANENQSVKAPMFQNGVLRTNCIDCLDRTSVAQYAYGLVALGHQLHALGFIESPIIDLDNPLAEDLMGIYDTMGDTLALQYGGSAADNEVILFE